MAPRSISAITKCYLPGPCLMSGPLLFGQNFVMVIRRFTYKVTNLRSSAPKNVGRVTKCYLPQAYM